MKSLTNFIAESMQIPTEDMKVFNTTPEEVQSTIESNGASVKKITKSEDDFTLELRGLDETTAPAIASKYDMVELKKADIKARRKNMFMNERVWVKKIDDKHAFIFSWAGALKKKPWDSGVFQFILNTHYEWEFMKFVK